MPSRNLVQNLGMGPLSTHTKYDTQQPPYPASIEELSFPLTNKSRTRDLDFERKYFKNTKLSLIRKIKGFLKNIYEYLFLANIKIKQSFISYPHLWVLGLIYLFTVKDTLKL